MKRFSKLLNYALIICIVCANIVIVPIDVNASGSATSNTPIEETVTTSDDGKLSVTSSGQWLNTKRTKAQLNIDLESSLHMISGRPRQDIIFVVDESGSMRGDRLAKVKESLFESPKTLLDVELDNRIALVGFSTRSSGFLGLSTKDNTTTHMDFTKDASAFTAAVNRLDYYNGTPYVSGLNRARSLITSRHDKSREPVVIFMSDGLPNENYNSIRSAANDLKNLGADMYAIQYMYGGDVSKELKVIATKPENVYNAPSKNSVLDIYRKVIGEVKGESRKYKDITIEIPFDNGNFDIGKISSTVGSIKQEGKVLKWTIPALTSGYDANASINLELSDESLEGNLYLYNQGSLKYSAQDIQGAVKTVDSPTLTRTFYKVQYEGNDNTGGSTPADDKVIGLDTYEIPDNPGFLSKKGEVFNGWQRADTGEVVTRRIVMPEQDIVLKAVWGKVHIQMNSTTIGSVNTMETNALRNAFTNYANITKVEFVKEIKTGTDLSKEGDESIVGWVDGTTLYVGSPETVYLPEDASSLFEGFQTATAINFNGLVSSYYTTNMSSMFKGCGRLSSIDLGAFDTSKVTNMSSMFNGCKALTALDVNHFDTSNVTNMQYMFNDCSSLRALEISNFRTEQVTDMQYMFYNCRGLTNLNVSNFITSRVTAMNHMFATCGLLTNLDLSSFNTSQVTNMTSMFAGCGSLTNLDLSSFNTSQVTNMTSMFAMCGNLQTLNTSSFNTSQVTSMYNMFGNCQKLKSIDLTSFDTTQVTTMYQMFGGCDSLTTLDLSSFDTSNVDKANIINIFHSCWKLTSVFAKTQADADKLNSSGNKPDNLTVVVKPTRSIAKDVEGDVLQAPPTEEVELVAEEPSLEAAPTEAVEPIAEEVEPISEEPSTEAPPEDGEPIAEEPSTEAAPEEEVEPVAEEPSLEAAPAEEVEPVAEEPSSKATRKATTTATTKAATTKATPATTTLDFGRINTDAVVDYDITVSYTATAEVKSKVLSIKNRLPEGMSYVADTAASTPPVRIVAGDGGLASGDLYDIKVDNEVLTFKIKNLSEGSKIQLAYKAKAPSSVPDGYQEFLNQASVSVEEVTETSNYVRHYIGLRTKPLHTFTYKYDNTAATDAPDLPPAMEYVEGQKINVINVGMPGYIFNGWKVDGVLVDSDTFIMPDKNVDMVGSWTKLTETNALKASVSYEYRGDVPEGVSPPNKVDYTVGSKVDDVEKVNGKTVYIYDIPSAESGYSFEGWKSDDLTAEELSDQEFVLGKKDVVIYGVWTKDTFKVKYEYQGEKPENAPDLPAEETYSWGETVDLLEPLDPVGNISFDGWYCDEEIDPDFNESKSFTMPREDVRLFAMWATDPFTITYKHEGEIPKDVEREDTDGAYQDAVNSVWMAPETVEITNNDGVPGEWTFEGWETKDVQVEADGTYVMPDKNIEFVGKWSFEENENVRRVKFVVEHGTWADGSSDDLAVVKVLKDGKATLDADEVPTGMVANEGYGHGEWMEEPNTSSGGISDNVTYRYHFYKEERVKVKFVVKNGTWEDGSTQDKEVEILLLDERGTLKEVDVPVGMKANKGYIDGSWDVKPNTEEGGIDKATTYTYTFSKDSTNTPKPDKKDNGTSTTGQGGVDTGDTANSIVIVGILVAAAVVIVYVLISKKKRRDGK